MPVKDQVKDSRDLTSEITFFPRCHSVLHHQEFSVFPSSHLHPHHSEEEALPLQVLGGRKLRRRKKINLSSYFLSPRPSFYISPIKSTLQHCQYCWTGDAHIGRISLIIRFAFKSTQPPLSVSLCSIRCDPQPGAQ